MQLHTLFFVSINNILFKVCDGKYDCENGEDENGHCDDSCSMLQCSENQFCQHTPHLNGTCLCDFGYQMNDESMCIDIDECQSLPPLCSQVSLLKVFIPLFVYLQYFHHEFFLEMQQ